MSDLTRWSLPPDFVARVTAMVPAATAADFAVLVVLIQHDRMILDSNGAHPALVNWVAGILDRDGGVDPVMAVPPPRPKTGPVGAEVAL